MASRRLTTRASIRRNAMANSTDLNGHGSGMRNGHVKTTRGPEGRRVASSGPRPEERRAVPKKGAGRQRPEGRGVRVERRFTVPAVDPLDAVVYERRASAISNPDGSIVFRMDGAEVPASWSQLATDIVISKYFRKAGLHGDKDEGETSVRQVVHRLAHTVRSAGEAGARKVRGRTTGAYFATKADADAFEAELAYLLVNQYGAFNSPVWFNLGLWHEYGITGSGGNWAWDGRTDAVTE